MPPSTTAFAETQASVHRNLEIVLEPISHPEYGDIRLENNRLAVGRSEMPFASYSHEIAARLSRQHAKIFCEGGAAHVADLGSRNGTTVNGLNVREKPCRLRDGDEICFGGVLSYRVHLGGRADASPRDARLPKLTLVPERTDLGLQPIVVARFPFLISKSDETVARYRDEYPHQVNYVSRRHAQFFLRGATPFVEDLRSTNGTFVGGERLGEHPVPLQNGDILGFGGRHFVYRVSLETPPTATKVPPVVPSAAGDSAGQENTDPAANKAPPVGPRATGDSAGQAKTDPPATKAAPVAPSAAGDAAGQAKTDPRPSNAPPVGPSAASDSVGHENTDPAATKAAPVPPSAAADSAGPDKPDPTPAKAPPVAPSAAGNSAGEDKTDPTAGKAPPVGPSAAGYCAGPDNKTMFVAAGASFLDIFCGDHGQQSQHESPDEGAKSTVEGTQQTERPRERSRLALFVSELIEAFAGGERGRLSRPLWWTASLVAALGAVALLIYLNGASQRKVRDLFASGEYGRTVTAANRYLEQHPDDAEIKALSTEALLKGNVPSWLAMLTKHDFDGASAALAGMREASRRNENVKSWVSDLEWLADLERFVRGRGGRDAPIRIYVDEEKIKVLLKYWNDDTQAHQRTFETIASYVPEFKDAYAEALSHVRKLQSDDSVYLTAIERLKSTISTELNRDAPEALETALKEYSEKYPRLGGLDRVREDLRQYLEVEAKVRARRLGPLITLRAKMRFSTPPFQDKFRALISSERFPPANLVEQYEAVSQAWREGDAKRAVAALQGMRAGAWTDAAAMELEHKRAITEQYTALQKSRDANGYEDRLIRFYGSLDADEDEYFIRATKADVALYKDKALARAKEAVNRAETMWRQYRESGAIAGKQRLEGEISSQFRTQARLLSEAEGNARHGIRIYALLKLDHPAQWSKVQEEINAEAEIQRRSLLDLRKVLEPRLFKAKLALLEGRSDD
jgi:pSer/pThr/pTyr-binding forkhead associated (FHA) protein